MKTKNLLFVLPILLFSINIQSQNVVITDDDTYTSSSTNALLEIKSANNNKGILIPRITTLQRNSINLDTLNDKGLMVYDTTTNSFWYYNGTSWIEVGGGSGSSSSDEIKDADNDTKIQVESSPDDDYIMFYTAGNNVMSIDNTGKLSIGNQLELQNTTSSTSGVIYKGGYRFIHNNRATSTDGANTFVGKDAGNFSMAYNSNLTDASYNSGFGAGSLNDLTYGGYNTASGAYALSKNTTANNNVAVGTATLYKTTTGGNNVAIGQKSGYNNQTGSGNIFIGNEAGYYETGSNKLYIDNSNTSSPLISGDFSSDAVTINGTVKITGGSPGNGKVLTSDASGNATWENASSGGASEINDLDDAATDATSVFLGDGSGDSDDGSNNNTFVGIDAGTATTSGINNVYIGYQSGSTATASNANTFIGFKSGTVNTASSNTFIGYQSGLDNTSGYANTFLGTSTGENNTEGVRNVFIGRYAGMANTTGNYSIGIGPDALKTQTGYGAGSTNNLSNIAIGSKALETVNPTSATNGRYNIAIGTDAGKSTTTGYCNLFLGHASGTNTNTGYRNTFIGFNSGKSNTSGNLNFFIGDSAGFSNTTGSESMFMGINAGYSNSSGDYNTFIGNYAGESNTSGNRNIFIGYKTGNNSFGSDNTFIGNEVGTHINGSSANYNTAIGNYAGKNLFNATNNVFIGQSSGHDLQSGTGNVFIGNESGKENNGSHNTFIGHESGEENTGSYNVFIGYEVGATTFNNYSYTLAIGNADVNPLIYGRFDQGFVQINGNLNITQNLTMYDNINLNSNWLSGDGDDEGVYVKSDGNVGIGTSSPDQLLDVRGSAQLKNTSGDVDLIIDGTSSNNTVTFNENGTYAASVGYNTTDDYLFLYEGGNVVVKDGDMGIGENNPDEKLHVNGKIKVEDNIIMNGEWLSGDGGNEGVYVDNSGKVGINTSSPDLDLQVNGSFGVNVATSNWVSYSDTVFNVCQATYIPDDANVFIVSSYPNCSYLKGYIFLPDPTNKDGFILHVKKAYSAGDQIYIASWKNNNYNIDDNYYIRLLDDYEAVTLVAYGNEWHILNHYENTF